MTEDIMVFDGMQRNRDATAKAEFPGPHSPSENNSLCPDNAVFKNLPGAPLPACSNDLTALVQDVSHPRVFDDRCATGSCPLGHRDCDFLRYDLAIMRQPCAPLY